jgi:hypothetical protein
MHLTFFFVFFATTLLLQNHVVAVTLFLMGNPLLYFKNLKVAAALTSIFVVGVPQPCKTIS